jgi:hypothetical protein
MRREKSYIRKYGRTAGSKMFRALQKEAAQARWKAHYRKKLKAES